ncbi:MAG: hypothetical protein HYU51_16310 [Candidatus Rokubacteria bacterium]|nr:hypothetical protein [Candidatus Rokubacteria bacterium]
MRRRGRALLAVAALLATLMPAVSATAGAPARPARPAREAMLYRLTAQGHFASGARVRGHRFRINDVREIIVETQWWYLTSDRTERVKLITQEGHVYQEWENTLAPAPGRRGRTQAAGTTRIPVAGTSITRHALTGRWRLEVWLDGDSQPRAVRPLSLTR